MEGFLPDRPAYSLYELNSIIKSALDLAFPEAYWITAEIAECKCNQRGHCYLELVEKDENRVIAQVKANIWAYDYRKLSHKFHAATGEALKPGIKIMLLAAVTFHEVFGLSLNVRDIDPAYTIGEMARKKREVIERLEKEGLINLNKGLPLPLVPQRVAVISSPTAAGYGDFFNQLDRNPYGYGFLHILFKALMQGQDAENSIISALNRIKDKKHLFDAVVIIRGGGSAADLSCFDNYGLASCVAKFPLPVITGIGHEKDDTVVDMVAHTRMKTPTAVAEFLISGARSFEERIIGVQQGIKRYAEVFLKDSRLGLDSAARKLVLIPSRMAALRHRLLMLGKDIAHRTGRLLQKHSGGIDNKEQAIRLLDSANVLRRGYSITRHNGKVLRDASVVKSGMAISTKLFRGAIESIVGRTKEVKKSEQSKTVDLLPGFE